MASRNQLSYFVLLFLLCAGCSLQPFDYSAFKESKPRSILVIPPRNHSIETNAPYIFLSTISKPIAEKGYYVFPVAVIDQFLKENGLLTPAEMNTVSLDQLHQYFGADAVLYVTIQDWGQRFQIFKSSAVVSSSWKLVDARTGVQIWQGRAYAEDTSGNHSGGGIESIIAAVVTQVVNSIADMTPSLSEMANYQTVNAYGQGFLPGPYARPEDLEASEMALSSSL